MSSAKRVENKIIILALILIMLVFGVLLVFNYFIIPLSESRLATNTNKWDGSVSTSFSSGNGSLENPYMITSGSDLAYLSELLKNDATYQDKYYKLSSDIDLDNKDFTPLSEFKGTFDGDGFTIANIRPNSTDSNIGLFENTENATITNLNLENIEINSSSENIGTLVGVSANSNFKNITVINSTIKGDSSNIGGLVGSSTNSNYQYIYVNSNISDKDKDGGLIGTNKDSSFVYTIINSTINNSPHSDNFFGNNDKEYTGLYYYYKDDGIKYDDNTYDVDSFLKYLNKDTDKLKWQNYNNNLVYEIKDKNVVKIPIRRAPAATMELHDSGIDGDTVYVNDLDADWNYYYGLNYATSTNNRTPTMVNKNLYNRNNLVRVKITYNGSVDGDVGTVSDTETQSKYVYYKYYPVENNSITIELIDNPFSNRPSGKAFGGWSTTYENVSMWLDQDIYVRYAKIPVTFTNGVPNEIQIDFNAVYVPAKTAYLSQNSWDNIRTNLNDVGFKKLATTKVTIDGGTIGANIYKVTRHVNQYTQFSGTNQYGYYSQWNWCDAAGGCDVFSSATGDTYDADTLYYVLNGQTGAREATLDELGVQFHEEADTSFNGKNMSGYYNAVTLTNGQAYQDMYDASENYNATGTCNNQNGCTMYKMIQSETFDSSKSYYYMVTRDTNIIVMNQNTTGSWGTNLNVPFTLTSLNDGTRYNVTWTLTGNAWDSTINYTKCYSDVVLENLRIYSGGRTSNTNPTGSSTAQRYFYGNEHNVKIGRNVVPSRDGYTTFNGFLGSGNTGNGGYYGSTYNNIGWYGNEQKWRMIIESGVYSTGGILTGESNSGGTNYIELSAIFGSDYDRVNNNDNSKLTIVDSFAAFWSGNNHTSSSTKPIANINYKSGSYGTGRYDNVSGIYVGGRSYGNRFNPVVAVIEGGYFYNVIGGPSVDSSRADYNDTYIYIKGGSIDNLNGGAGTSETYGNRIISMTGGTINYSLFGGSNAYNEYYDSDAGQLHGDSYIYVGGNAVVGNADYVANNSTLWNAEAGAIFGNGDGNDRSDSIGSNDNAYITIDGNALVRGNVYGGGNYGAVGVETNNSSSETKIQILNGTINGSVFGAGNNNGGGTNRRPSNTSITMSNGHVLGDIYGGANAEGTLYGDSTINITGGTIDKGVYGGGKGGYSSRNNPGTYVNGNINVTIGPEGENTPISIDNVYGGSAFGAVGTTSQTNAATTKTVNVTINGGTIKSSVYGGGEGDDTYTPIVAGPINVTINNGSIGNVYGANNASGVPLSTIEVDLNGGKANGVYGGGNNAGANTTTINAKNGTFTEIYGGSNQSGTVANSTINFDGGTVNTIYGGNNAGGTTSNSNVIINADVPTVYGGNNIDGETTKSNVTLNKGNVSSIYGGGNQADTGDTNVAIKGGNVTSLYGGGNNAGATSTTMNITGGTITNAYGGSNQSGLVETTNVNVNAGSNIGNLYGGGNYAETNYNNVTVTGGTVSTDLYGGGNHSKTNNDVKVDVKTANIGNLYGGGNEGEVSGKVNLTAEDANVTNSIYGGGNKADVIGDVVVNIGGQTNAKSAFAGGNHGNIGSATSNATATINIKGATIAGNVYGGCNTAVVNGNTKVNIGKKDDVTVKDGNIKIGGTVFGGGEANAEGSENYDFSFISVTNGIDININGEGYTGTKTFEIDGSIFGSGNASSSSGTSTIYIKDLGTRTKPNVNISIQRANKVTLDNSAIELLGATDRTNEYSNIEYSLNRIDDLTIKNNSTLLLQKNANILKAFNSKVDVDGKEELATADVKEDGTTTRNVDNRLYDLAGTKLNVLLTQNIEDYGTVKGMTFYGMYTKNNDGTYNFGIYDEKFKNGDAANAGNVIIGNSYVMGAHLDNHDITKDGFYTNYIDDDYTKVETKYIVPTPSNSNYYMWAIGVGAKEFQVDLTASKYSSLGTKALSMNDKDLSKGDTIFNVVGLNTGGLASGIKLVDPSKVPNINKNVDKANTNLGLAMKAESNEWINYGSTTFISNDTINGDTAYQTDSKALAPSFAFYLYRAKNATKSGDLGSVVITLQALVPKNEIEYNIELITITVNIDAVNYDDGNAYDATITYGRKYEMPATTSVNITNKSQLSAYFGLFVNDEKKNIYGNNGDYYHTLVSNYAFPVGTKITMIDLGISDTSPEEYYYKVDNASYTKASNDLASKGEVEYKLSDFIRMGSTNNNDVYNDKDHNSKYYNEEDEYAYEKFIFIVDFENTNVDADALNNTLLFEIRNADDRSIISVLGIKQGDMVYNLYNQESNIQLNQTATLDSDYIYQGENDIAYSTGINYTQTENRQTIIDTNFENSNMGLNISLYDSSNSLISSSQLEDTYVMINGQKYQTDSNGIFRIKLANKVTTINRTMNLNIGNSLQSGNYKIEFKLFASNDGQYSDGTKDTINNLNKTLLNSENLIVSENADKKEMITDKNKATSLNYNFKYESLFQNPNIRFILSKRNTDDSSTTKYTEIDPNTVFTNTFTMPSVMNYTGSSPSERILTDSPESEFSYKFDISDKASSGTYKLEFELYNADRKIDSMDMYFIVKTDPDDSVNASGT